MPISYIPQNILLMPGNVFNNMMYPLESGDQHRVIEALKAVNLYDDLLKLPQQLNTLIGDGGHGLSGGQAQRVLLARLWYHQSPLVLIDEGTSALDPQVEQEIYAFLKTMASKGSTVIMIAHRYSATEISDEILLLENGILMDHGSLAQVKQSEHFSNVFG